MGTSDFIFISHTHESKRRNRASRLALAVAVALAWLSGCGDSTARVASSQLGAALQGHVRGGQQPVAGASIELYAAGSAGVGVGATNLLAPNIVISDGSGNFSITSDYVCPTAATQLYLVARGGNPGLAVGVNNMALVMMAALGNCGDLTSATSVVIDEVTTVAAVWALSQFMSTGGVVGSTATNAMGLQNAFSVAKNLADIGTGMAPGVELPAGAVTESAKLYTLANALAACVNSDGGAACGPLFVAATLSGSAPTNTLDAALNVVEHPGSNVAAVFDAGSAQGPFQPGLSATPNDWTMSITYGGCTPACGGLNLPGGVAVDSSGNIFVANYFGGVVSKFSPSGAPASSAGIVGVGLNESFGVAIDGSDNVWIANNQSVTGADNHHYGSISEFSSAGVELSGYGYTGGGVYYPLALATDADGDVWVADYGSSSATLLADDGSAISGGNGYGTSALPFTSAVAVNASHSAWFAVQDAVVRVTPLGAVTSFACCSDPAGVAIDDGGDVWIADYSTSAIVELSSSGSVANRTTVLGGDGGPKGIAVDGAGNVWAANYYGNALVELAGSTAIAISPSHGYGLDAPLNEPYGLAIDASGGVWLSNAAANTLTQFVGLASPIKTPLLGPPAQP